MSLEICIPNRIRGELLRAHPERRLRFAISRLGDRVGRVAVRSGGHDGIGATEKRSRMRVECTPFGSVSGKETGTDPFEAIDPASGRLARLIRQRLQRTR